MNFIIILQVVGLIQGITLSLVLFSINQGNLKANKYLAISAVPPAKHPS